MTDVSRHRSKITSALDVTMAGVGRYRDVLIMCVSAWVRDVVREPFSFFLVALRGC
jgi:hypothetical protein